MMVFSISAAFLYSFLLNKSWICLANSSIRVKPRLSTNPFSSRKFNYKEYQINYKTYWITLKKHEFWTIIKSNLPNVKPSERNYLCKSTEICRHHPKQELSSYIIFHFLSVYKKIRKVGNYHSKNNFVNFTSFWQKFCS